MKLDEIISSRHRFSAELASSRASRATWRPAMPEWYRAILAEAQAALPKADEETAPVLRRQIGHIENVLISLAERGEK